MERSNFWEINPNNAGSIISGQGNNQPEVVWHIPGNHNMSLTLCGQTVNVPIEVFPAPDFNLSDYTSCGDEKVSIDGPPGMSAYSWKDSKGTELGTSSTNRIRSRLL